MSRATRLTAALLGAAAALAALATLALGADVEGYDGSIPFVCELQQAGQGTDFPDPDADPFCVEYDKTNQDVSDLSIVEFLEEEPARVAAATGKCFYFQKDHWRGRVIAGNPASETYSWDGAYYLDRAKGEGGAFVENFTLNGETVDPTVIPGFPKHYEPFFGEGRGGLRIADSIPIDPRCIERAEEGNVYPGEGGDGDGGDGGGDPGNGGSGNGGGGSGGTTGGNGGDAGTGPGFSEARRDPSFTG